MSFPASSSSSSWALEDIHSHIVPVAETNYRQEARDYVAHQNDIRNFALVKAHEEGWDPIISTAVTSGRLIASNKSRLLPIVDRAW